MLDRAPIHPGRRRHTGSFPGTLPGNPRRSEGPGTRRRLWKPRGHGREIVRAAGTPGIHDFIAGLPEGYRTQIGERGILLSEGQKQRLCIARALLKRPDVILLDEPSAALDGQTAKNLLSSLRPALAGRTVIVISNEEEWLKACDRVLYLEDRRLSAIGAHAELMGSNEAYAALVRGAQ